MNHWPRGSCQKNSQLLNQLNFRFNKEFHQNSENFLRFMFNPWRKADFGEISLLATKPYSLFQNKTRQRILLLKMGVLWVSAKSKKIKSFSNFYFVCDSSNFDENFFEKKTFLKESFSFLFLFSLIFLSLFFCFWGDRKSWEQWFPIYCGVCFLDLCFWQHTNFRFLFFSFFIRREKNQSIIPLIFSWHSSVEFCGRWDLLFPHFMGRFFLFLLFLFPKNLPFSLTLSLSLFLFSLSGHGSRRKWSVLYLEEFLMQHPPPTRFKPPVPPKVWKPEIMDATQFKFLFFDLIKEKKRERGGKEKEKTLFFVIFFRNCCRGTKMIFLFPLSKSTGIFAFNLQIRHWIAHTDQLHLQKIVCILIFGHLILILLLCCPVMVFIHGLFQHQEKKSLKEKKRERKKKRKKKKEPITTLIISHKQKTKKQICSKKRRINSFFFSFFSQEEDIILEREVIHYMMELKLLTLMQF